MIIEDVVESVASGKSVEEAVAQLLDDRGAPLTAGPSGLQGGLGDRSRLARKPGPTLGPPTAPSAPRSFGKPVSAITGMRKSIFGKAASFTGGKLIDKFGGGMQR